MDLAVVYHAETMWNDHMTFVSRLSYFHFDLNGTGSKESPTRFKGYFKKFAFTDRIRLNYFFSIRVIHGFNHRDQDDKKIDKSKKPGQIYK